MSANGGGERPAFRPLKGLSLFNLGAEVFELDICLVEKFERHI
jgi:hypothetical protein